MLDALRGVALRGVALKAEPPPVPCDLDHRGARGGSGGVRRPAVDVPGASREDADCEYASSPMTDDSEAVWGREVRGLEEVRGVSFLERGRESVSLPPPQP